MRSISRVPVVRTFAGALCVVLLGAALAACSGSGSPKVTPNPSDPSSLAEANLFARKVHAASPASCKVADISRDITNNPKFGLPPIGAESRCTAWGDLAVLYAFTNTSYRDTYMKVATAAACAASKSGLHGYHWVVRPTSATLVPTIDVARMLAVVLPGTYQFVGCQPGPAPKYIAATTELDAIGGVLDSGGVKCGSIVLRPSDPIETSSFAIDPDIKVLQIVYGTCSDNPAIQLVGIFPPSAGPKVTPLPKVLAYFCQRDASLNAIHGLTWVALTKDASLSARMAPVLKNASAPVCSAT